MKKYRRNDGVEFWAEQVEISKTPCFAVISQMPGFPATEAHDDWFGFEKDADEMAEQLSREPVHG